MKKLLFISTYPFPLDMGCNQHAYYFLKVLSRYFKVYCVFFIPPHKIHYPHVKRELMGLNIKEFKICYFKKPLEKKRYSRLIRRISSFPGSYMNLAYNPIGVKTIQEFIKKYSIEIVHFEHFNYTKYAFKIKNGIKKVVVYHDLHHTIFKQQMHFEEKSIRRFLLFISFIKYYLFERLLEYKIDTKIFLNPIEMNSLPNNSIHIPHIVNPNIVFRSARDKNNFNILFLGAYNHPPNRLSFQYILTKILPKLIQKEIQFKIHIIGSDTEKFFDILNKYKYKDSILLRGFVEDINQVFDDMDIALFPILYGGGIKTKVIDTMAAGVPIVTTPQGIIGLNNLPKDSIGIGTNADQILQELEKLMINHSLRLKRAKSGREYVKNHHSFKTFEKKIRNSYLNI